MANMNDILAQIVLANGGTITDKNNRNGLLRDWLDSYGASTNNAWTINGDTLLFNGDNVVNTLDGSYTEETNSYALYSNSDELLANGDTVTNEA